MQTNIALRREHMSKEKPDYYDDTVKELGEGFVIIQRKIALPAGKTTIQGDHPKLAADADCAFPERASCNHGDFFTRCPYMVYNRTEYGGNWRCTFKQKK